jgi:lysophospholipase L1-like esterase
MEARKGSRRQAMRGKAAEVGLELARAAGKVLVAAVVFFGITGGYLVWQAKRFAAAEAASPLPEAGGETGCTIWVVGTSSMRRWASLERDMRPWTTRNRSVAGATLGELNHRFENEAHPRPPEAIVFYAGENDIAFGGAADKAFAEFERFMALKSQKLGDVPVLAVSVKPSPTRWANFPEQSRFNAALRRMAAAREDLDYVDVVSGMLIGGRPGPFYDEDGIHLNDAGYRVWARTLRAAVGSDLPAPLVRRCTGTGRRA